jgi:hypothetical protein
MENHYLKNPIKVRVRDPIGQVDLANYVYLGAIPKQISDAVHHKNTKVLREYYGSKHADIVPTEFDPGKLRVVTGGDDDFDDIEELLEESVPETIGEALPVITHEGLHYVTTVHIYPDDNITEVKEKIYLSTHIPPYRQHLFWINRAGIIDNPYVLRTNFIYETDINRLSTYTDTILGMPIDKTLYMNRESIKVESNDDFTLLNNILGSHNNYTLYVVDLAAFTRSKQVQLIDIVRDDEYQLELLYYSFIIKYWPQLTLETFKQYLMNESDLPLKYPELAKDKDHLKSVYRAESDIIDFDYKYSSKLREPVTSAIVAMTTVVTDDSNTVLNLRNLFDLLECNSTLVEIHAYVNTNANSYMLRKRHVSMKTPIVWPSGPLLRDGLNIACNTSSQAGVQVMFISIKSDGNYYISSTWHEEDNLDFDQIRVRVAKVIDPIITLINSYGRSVFAEGKALKPFIKQNITYKGLSACIFWKKVMIESAFKQVRNALDPYTKARLIIPRNISNDKFEFMWRKGMHEFDIGVIERILSAASGLALNNYYSHLSNAAVHQKWLQNYDGRIARMHHRTTDIKFEIIDVHQDEFNIFRQYIEMFIHRAAQLPSLKASQRDYKDVKKIRKLREQDPELYNTKKHGSDQLYSIKCQNPRQPMIYTADELKSLSKEKSSKLVSYWNFTFKRPAYYSCPNPEYPYMSFLVDIHPRGYCLPCCSKKPQSQQGVKKQGIRETCMRHHVYNEKLTAEMSRHIVGYGKDVDPGRLSNINQALKQVFIPPEHISMSIDGETQLVTVTKSKTPAGYYLCGVNQNTISTSGIGFINSVAHALGTDTQSMTRELLSAVNESTYEQLLSGTIIEYWDTYKEFINTLTDTFIHNKPLVDSVFNRWPELFSDLLILMNVAVVVFTERADMYCDPHVASALTSLSPIRYVFINKRDTKYYPIYLIAPDRYFSTSAIIKSWYTHEDLIVKSCSDALKVHNNGEHSKAMDIDAVKKFCDTNTSYVITSKLLNIHGVCYAVIINSKSGNVYCPIEYSIYTSDGIPISHKFNRDNTYTYSAVIKFVASWNKFASEKYRLVNLDALRICRTKPMSVSSGHLHFYIGSIDTDNKLPIIDMKYDYADVNNSILSREGPTNSSEHSSLLASSLYHNYLYQLFLIEFMNYVESERNLPLRKQLLTIVNSHDIKQRNEIMVKIKILLVDYPDDIAWLDAKSARAAYSLNKKAFIEDIESHAFIFDKITINKLKSLSDSEMVTELKSIANEFTVQGVANIKNFPNIYEPCKSTHDSIQYCSKRKLIIDQPIDDLVSLLMSDLKNELKSKFLLDTIWYDTIVNYFDFIRRPNESIDIYKM